MTSHNKNLKHNKRHGAHKIIKHKQNGYNFLGELDMSKRKMLSETFELLRLTEIDSNIDRIEGMKIMLENRWKEVRETKKPSGFKIDLYPNNPNYVDWVYEWKGRLCGRIKTFYDFSYGRQWVHQNRAKYACALFLDMLSVIEQFVCHMNVPDNSYKYHLLELLKRLLRQKYQPRSLKAEDTLIICPGSISKSDKFREQISNMTGLVIDKNLKSQQIADKIDKFIQDKYKNNLECMNYFCEQNNICDAPSLEPFINISQNTTLPQNTMNTYQQKEGPRYIFPNLQSESFLTSVVDPTLSSSLNISDDNLYFSNSLAPVSCSLHSNNPCFNSTSSSSPDTSDSSLYFPYSLTPISYPLCSNSSTSSNSPDISNSNSYSLDFLTPPYSLHCNSSTSSSSPDISNSNSCPLDFSTPPYSLHSNSSTSSSSPDTSDSNFYSLDFLTPSYSLHSNNPYFNLTPNSSLDSSSSNLHSQDSFQCMNSSHNYMDIAQQFSHNYSESRNTTFSINPTLIPPTQREYYTESYFLNSH